MIKSETIAALQGRLDKAMADCESWRASGQEEKYLETYCLIEAIEAQLRERLRSTTQ